MPTLGETFPNFSCQTTVGDFSFHDWLGKSSVFSICAFLTIYKNELKYILLLSRWGILFSHPADFTPVCTSELARLVNLVPEFKKRNVKIMALSCDSVTNHHLWLKDIKFYAGL